MAKKRKIVDALSPLDAITSMILTVLATLAVMGAAAAVAGENISLFDIGADSICTSANFSPADDGESSDELDRRLHALQDGVDVHSASTEMCQSAPSAAQTALSALAQVPSFIVFVGFLLLTRRTIRFARRDGIFSQLLALRIERLGWFLLLGLVGAAAVEWLADGLLKTSMSSMGWASGEVHLSVAGVIAAYGVISIGRVMARAAALQAEADTTI